MKTLFNIVLLSLWVWQTSWAMSVPKNTSAGIQITADLSQTKLIQHGTQTIFVEVTLHPPSSQQQQPIQQRQTDIVIVLDRSGSMSEAKKMTYAKAAIQDVLGRLTENDRFALVSFSNNALVQSSFINVTTDNRYSLQNTVNSIKSSGGTNMGDGLMTALQLLQNNRSDNAKKVLLLSDGQANQGITNPEQLAQIASTATRHGAVVSSIGMGLGFNEVLLSKIADYGMGHYSYLEDLSGLSNILSRDLNDTRRIYANSSLLEIKLSHGIQLIDAGGYPITKIGGSTINIMTGQLLFNTPKHFVMTFKVPTHEINQFSLGAMQLNYQQDKTNLQAHLSPEKLTLSVVAPELKEQVKKSINKAVYEKSWLENNLGRMQRSLSQYIREGNKEKAKQVIRDYRQNISEASSVSEVQLGSPVIEEKLEAMSLDVEQAFEGNSYEQKLKQNRAAKTMQYDSIKIQRK